MPIGNCLRPLLFRTRKCRPGRVGLLAAWGCGRSDRNLDDQTIAIPDRRGNNRLDTLENIVRDGRVALLFLIPGCDEALRINGNAIVTADPDLLARLAKQDRVPASAIIVTIQTMYFQCARAIRRAGLWAPESHCDRDDLPSAGDLLRSVDPDFEGEVYDSLASRSARNKPCIDRHPVRLRAIMCNPLSIRPSMPRDSSVRRSRISNPASCNNVCRAVSV